MSGRTEISGYVDREWDRTIGPRVFSGHESFPCRYGWLPKLYEAVLDDATLFTSIDSAILRLGVGRNMIKSLRFWGEAFGITRTVGREVRLTKFARMLLDPKTGLDPFLESPSTLWRLHWKLTVHGRLGAWTVGFLELRDREITRKRFIDQVRARAFRTRGTITERTAANHVDIFLRTYAGNQQSQASWKEGLDSPFQELDLIRSATSSGLETVRRLVGPKRTLDCGAFAFIVHDFWQSTAPGSLILSLRSLMLAHAAPSSVLLLDERSLYECIEELCSQSQGLKLQSDGVGGFDLASARQPLQTLFRIAWP